MDAYKKKWMHIKRNGSLMMEGYFSFSYQYEQSLKEKESLTTHLTQCQRKYDQALDDTKTENSKVKSLF